MIDIEDFMRKHLALYRTCEIRDDRQQRPGRGKKGKMSYGPYVLFSREKGAGGSAVGRLTGKRLGWQVFDNEIVDEIAQKANVRRELIESLDERDRGIIEEIVDEFFSPKSIAQSAYLTHRREVLLTLGHQGNVVIVGRGVQYLLPGQFGLRVRLVAPLDVRVRRIASRENMSLERARVAIKKSDRERTRLAFKEYRKILTDPLNYDVTINTAELTVEDATEIVLKALQRKLAVKLKGNGSA
jgi:cytidylate kinase